MMLMINRSIDSPFNHVNSTTVQDNWFDVKSAEHRWPAFGKQDGQCSQCAYLGFVL